MALKLTRRKTVRTQASASRKKLNPYMRFVKKTRPSFVSAHPKMSPQSVAKALGAKWRAMSSAQKGKF